MTTHRTRGSAVLALATAVAACVVGCGSNPLAARPDAPADAARIETAATPAAIAEPGRRRTPYRMLFIGNSLTQVNDLPAVVAELSRAAGDDPPLEVATVAFGGFSLEDHLAQGDARKAIAKTGWDVVVLQQGPSTLPESRSNLIQYTQRFAVYIRGVEARPALYGVWPEKERLDAFDDGIDSYRLAAEAVDGLLFPVALAWKTAWARDPSLPFYGEDDFHPSRLGTYMAALVIYAEVRDKSPVGLPATLTVDGYPYAVDPASARICQQVAQEITNTKARPGKPWGPRWPHADEPASAPGGGHGGEQAGDVLD